MIPPPPQVKDLLPLKEKHEVIFFSEINLDLYNAPCPAAASSKTFSLYFFDILFNLSKSGLKPKVNTGKIALTTCFVFFTMH